MHVILGILGGLVTMFYLLDRLGIDIGGLNPFHWYRRRAFAKKYAADPIYSVEDPLHIASLLVIGAAKLDGDITAEQKKVAQEQFISNFKMSAREAAELFGSAAHLLAGPQLLEEQMTKFAERSAGRFSREQAESMLDMMTTVAQAGGEASATQREFIEKSRRLFVPAKQSEGTWQ
jgi:hypothetical protein